jgi:hypothetical protein
VCCAGQMTWQGIQAMYNNTCPGPLHSDVANFLLKNMVWILSQVCARACSLLAHGVFSTPRPRPIPSSLKRICCFNSCKRGFSSKGLRLFTAIQERAHCRLQHESTAGVSPKQFSSTNVLMVCYCSPSLCWICFASQHPTTSRRCTPPYRSITPARQVVLSAPSRTRG